MKKKWFLELLGRRLIIVVLLLVQIAFIGYLIITGSRTFHIVNWILNLLSLAAALYIISKKEKGAYKLTWIILILVFPLFGGLWYLMNCFQTSTRKFSASIKKAEEKAAPLFFLPGDSIEEAETAMPQAATSISYLQKYAGFPIYDNTETCYYSPGEEFWRALLTELETAEHYIFLEYFIVEEGVMWNGVLDILKRKAAEGVTVRLIYDDLGCFFLLPKDYPKQLKKYGIECAVFNPFRPFLAGEQNNRDHRKIAVIDGKTAFTGGINLADEYINAVDKHGHWKDAGICLKGKAAWSFTLIFLETWAHCKKVSEDFHPFYPWPDGVPPIVSDGFVQPYADSPMDTENVGEHVYLQIIGHASRYVYIQTPYLIIDDSMVSALTLAAKSGVDVRIITPHRWDKRFVHMTTRSYYRELINAGIRIYEYSDGFIHSKTFVSDDRVATVGTTNLDFRSLYLHFECGVKLYGSRAVAEVREDFLATMKRSREITARDCRYNLLIRLYQDILRLFAPLM